MTKIPGPEDVPALQQFLDMVNYLQFLPNLSELAVSLRELTHIDIALTLLLEQAFDQLTSEAVTLTCNA